MAEQKRTDPDWQDLRVFLALGRHGSLSAAARALAVNHATIARRIQSLEASLGEKLVERRPDGYVLTAAGTRALSAAGDMETAVHALSRGGTDDDSPRGLVRVNAPPALSQGFLIDCLAALPVRYPGLDIDLATDLRSVSLERHETDVAVRVDRPLDGDFIARRLGSIAYGFYATPSVCERVAQGESPTFIGFNEASAYLPEATWLARAYPQVRVAFRANNQFAQATAARSGVGLALLPHYIGRQVAELRACDMPSVPPSREVWVLTRRQDRKDLPIRIVVEHAMSAFQEHKALFED